MNRSAWHALSIRRPAIAHRPRLDLWLPPGWPQAPRGELIYRWQPGGAAPAQYASLGSSHTPLSSLPQLAHTRLVVWAPGSEVLLFPQVRLPVRSGRTLAQALPYALEDQLLDEPEKLHFAYVRHTEALAVAVVARARLEHWQAALTEIGLFPEAIAPAPLSLPLKGPTHWALAWLDREVLLVRQGEYAGFACLGPFEPKQPPALLVAALAEARAHDEMPERLVVYANPRPEAISMEDWSAALGVPIEEDGRDFRFYDPVIPSLNLLQGTYAPVGRWRAGVRPYAPAAAMLAITLAGTLIVDAVTWWQLHQSQRALAAEMQTLYRLAFPSSQTALDPYRQMQRELERLEGAYSNRVATSAGASEFLGLLTRAAGALDAQPGLQLLALRYRSEGLGLVLHAADLETVHRLVARLQQQGLATEWRDSHSLADRAVQVELRIRATNAHEGNLQRGAHT